MRISQLEYFVASARCLSFTKAAKECFTVQSAISQQVTLLEDELGFVLFERRGKGIALTPAGERYYADTVKLLEQLSENKKNAMRLANGTSGILKVGLCGANQAAFMQELKQFYKENPSLFIQFCNVSTVSQLKELAEGKYDILYTALFNMSGGPADIIRFAGRHESTLGVYMHKDHPLARFDKISYEELAKWPNIYAEIPEGVTEGSTSEDVYSASGYKAEKEIYVSDQNISTLLLEFNAGVALAPVELQESMPKCVVFRPLEEELTIKLGWAYLADNNNGALERFVQYLKSIHHEM